MAKKKLLPFFCLLLVLTVSFCACSTQEGEESTYGGYTEEELYTVSAGTVESLASYTWEELNEYYEDLLNNGSSYLASGSITQAELDLNLDLCESWLENTKGLGDFVDYGDFSVTKAGSTISTDMTVNFTDGSATFELVYSEYDMAYPTGVTVSENLSMKKKLSQAGTNTVISLCIVFFVLILISLIIYAFRIFPYLDARKAARQAEKAKENEGEAPVEAVLEEHFARGQMAMPSPPPKESEDTELIAVIAAAIAAAEEVPADGFIVRSIRRRG